MFVLSGPVSAQILEQAWQRGTVDELDTEGSHRFFDKADAAYPASPHNLRWTQQWILIETTIYCIDSLLVIRISMYKSPKYAIAT